MLMYTTDGGGTGVVEIRAPAPLAVGITPIGAIGGEGVQAHTRPLANEMNHHLRLQQLSDMTAGPHAAIIDGYIPGSSLTPQHPQLLAQRWQYGLPMFCRACAFKLSERTSWACRRRVGM
jgi:hypothetical protein